MTRAGPSRQPYKNRILASLPNAELSRLNPYLSPLPLPANKTLQNPNEKAPYAYFLETGLASVVVEMADGNTVEAGITGKEGLIGIPAILGTKTMPTRTFMQIPGNGHKIKAERLKEEFERSGKLQQLVNNFFQTYLVQTSQTAACNRLHDIAERLARWLLMCHDRMESDTFSITHESLGHMLGTTRSTVSLTAGILHKAGLVEYSRGNLNITDRNGLEQVACGCYRAIRNESDRLDASFV